jgi:hypothetical protein
VLALTTTGRTPGTAQSGSPPIFVNFVQFSSIFFWTSFQKFDTQVGISQKNANAYAFSISTPFWREARKFD